MNGKSGIYCIYCVPTSKFYIGSANNCYKRMIVHKSQLNRNCHDNSYLQNAYNKYWIINFQFFVIEYCEFDKLLIKEQQWLDITHCWKRHIGYNISKIAGSTLGYKHSEETKTKMRKPKSEAHKEKIRITLTGIKIPEDRKIQISKNSKGKSKSDLHKLNMSIGKKGKPLIKLRNFIKWPHELASRCKCKECKQKWRKYHNDRYLTKSKII